MKTSSQCDYITGCELPKESGEDVHRAQMVEDVGGGGARALCGFKKEKSDSC